MVWPNSTQIQVTYKEGFANVVRTYMALVGISHYWGVSDTYGFMTFSKINLQVLWIEKVWLMSQELYHINQQLSQYDLPMKICFPQA